MELSHNISLKEYHAKEWSWSSSERPENAGHFPNPHTFTIVVNIYVISYELFIYWHNGEDGRQLVLLWRSERQEKRQTSFTCEHMISGTKAAIRKPAKDGQVEEGGMQWGHGIFPRKMWLKMRCIPFIGHSWRGGGAWNMLCGTFSWVFPITPTLEDQGISQGYPYSLRISRITGKHASSMTAWQHDNDMGLRKFSKLYFLTTIKIISLTVKYWRLTTFWKEEIKFA